MSVISFSNVNLSSPWETPVKKFYRIKTDYQKCMLWETRMKTRRGRGCREKREDDTTGKPIGTDKWKPRTGIPVACIRTLLSKSLLIASCRHLEQWTCILCSTAQHPKVRLLIWKESNKKSIVKLERSWESLAQCKIADERQGHQVPPCGGNSHCVLAGLLVRWISSLVGLWISIVFTPSLGETLLEWHPVCSVLPTPSATLSSLCGGSL